MEKLLRMRLKICLSIVFTFILSLQLYGQQLVLPGDNPDPTVVKIGDTYWAAGTTSNWFPIFPVYKSTDLVHWKLSAHVFNKMPKWADYYFWAPEMVYDGGKVYMYYSAHKRNGNLCVAVASADNPEGPYTDHGPLVCQVEGSIDAFEMRDTDGKLYLIWKDDGNSVGKHTTIWIQEINEERTKLLGQKKELFRNDKPWEGDVVEGVSMIRHGDYFYAFYAAGACCGVHCDYKGGVARAKNLLGPWEKYDKDPILVNTKKWICPGHGTPVEKDGRYYFLYHAYNAKSRNLVGRQGMLIEFKFTPDNWIKFIYDDKPGAKIPKRITDNFNGKKLSLLWHWSVFQKFNHKIKHGRLYQQALPTPTGSFLGQTTYQLNYDVEVEVLPGKSTARGGVALIGDKKNLIAAVAGPKNIEIMQVRNGADTIIFSQKYSPKRKLKLLMQVRNGTEVSFYVLKKNKPILLNNKPLNANYLPPWDRGLRVGLVSKGAKNERAVFGSFELRNL